MVHLIPDKAFNIQVSRALQKNPEWATKRNTVAQAVAANARALATLHKRSGQLASSIRVRHEKLDAYVEDTDPDAMHIEWGHYTGKRGDANREWVQGLHIMRTAALAAGASVNGDRPKG